MSHLNLIYLTYGSLRLNCVLLANCVPKYQISWGPYGPIFVIVYIAHTDSIRNFILKFTNIRLNLAYSLLLSGIDTCLNFIRFLFFYFFLFGSFGLSTKEPFTIMLCPPCVVIDVVLHRCHHLCTPPCGTGLYIETSYLVYLCTNVKYSVILTCIFKWYFSLICILPTKAKCQ